MGLAFGFLTFSLSYDGGFVIKCELNILEIAFHFIDFPHKLMKPCTVLDTSKYPRVMFLLYSHKLSIKEGDRALDGLL